MGYMDSIPESEVVRLWQQQMQSCRRLAGSTGENIEVIYPGRLNDNSGGDFRDAVVASGEGRRQGYIEIHTRSSGWVSHGHHRDPGYNQVVLHVALLEDYKGLVQRQDGQTIPTVILPGVRPAENPVAKSGSGLPCFAAGRRLGRDSLASRLQKEGDTRLRIRADYYQKEIEKRGSGQPVYDGLLEALGYSKNKGPFLKLASLAPLTDCEKIIQDERLPQSERLRFLQAFLLGTAGLLPLQGNSESSAPCFNQLEVLWPGISSPAVMNVREWELFKVRPGNHPRRRIMALSYLIQRCQPRGLRQTLIDLVRAATEQGAAPELESGFLVSADAGREGGSLLIGRARAAEIVINVLLPWALACSRQEGDRRMVSKIGRIFHLYPRRESHSLERHMMEQLEISSAVVKSACLQQGLIQVYKTRCIQGGCTKCIFGGYSLRST
jgi:hypothetical protein